MARHTRGRPVRWHASVSLAAVLAVVVVAALTGVPATAAASLAPRQATAPPHGDGHDALAHTLMPAAGARAVQRGGRGGGVRGAGAGGGPASSGVGRLPIVDCSGFAEQITEVRVNNSGGNWIKVETCAAPDGIECAAGSLWPYFECDSWLQPESEVRLWFARNSSYMALVYCVHNLEAIHCLNTPSATEASGPLWPDTVTIPYPSSSTSYCSADKDCPGSYCQLSHDPPTCHHR